MCVGEQLCDGRSQWIYKRRVQIDQGCQNQNRCVFESGMYYACVCVCVCVEKVWLNRLHTIICKFNTPSMQIKINYN